jgi:crossover junction endodeoxyribonuclease RusA
VSSAFEVTVPGVPVPKERPRVVTGRGRRPHAFTPARTRDYEQLVAGLALARGVRRIDGPVKLSVSFWCQDARRRDLDNLVKSIKDALNGVAWQDDSQVVELHATKGIDRDYPRVFIRIESIDSERSAA